MVPPGSENKVMHASFRIGDSTIMASDGHCQGKPNFQGFSLSLTVANDAEADRLFNALADGGQVQMPLTKTFFAPKFGMLADRFGVGWMVTVAPDGGSKEPGAIKPKPGLSAKTASLGLNSRQRERVG
jgi:PhnB protein